jgi:ABC-type nitrate/sulfonate/bicarbonate transport system substrate-binding protein
MNLLEYREFRAAIQDWIAAHPEEARNLLQEAMGEISSEISSISSSVSEAQWASRWARKFWAAAGVEPPRR